MKISSKFAVILLGKVDFLRLFKFNFYFLFAESLSSTCFFFTFLMPFSEKLYKHDNVFIAFYGC